MGLCGEKRHLRALASGGDWPALGLWGHRNGILSPSFPVVVAIDLFKDCTAYWEQIFRESSPPSSHGHMAPRHGGVAGSAPDPRQSNSKQNYRQTYRFVQHRNFKSFVDGHLAGTAHYYWATTGSQKSSANIASKPSERSWAKTIGTAKQKLAFSSLFPSSHSDQILLMNDSFVPEMYVFPKMPSVGH